MQLRPESLAGHLAQQCLPVYLVSGDETLLVQESCDQIRRRAREAGCAERLLMDAGASGFSWDELHRGATEMSLFAERRLLELRLPSGKPGAEGSKALCEYLERGAAEDILLIVAGRVEKQSQSSKWYRALDDAGAIVTVWPVRGHDLPRWMQRRLGAAGLDIEREALQLLCERVEGNLLAAAQEVEKLKLLASDRRITVDTVTAAVTDNARYNVYELADSALKGDAAASLRILHGLRGEGTEPVIVLWAIARELRTLYQVQIDCEGGQNAQRALAARKVWKNRVPLFQAALARHDSGALGGLLQQAGQVDGSIKGYADGSPWNRLETLVTALCR